MSTFKRRPSPTGTTLTTNSSIPLCCSSPSAFGPPPLIVVPVSTTASPSCSSSSAVVFTNGSTTKCSSTAATVSATALAAADSSTRKRFLCDLCSDVSFLALETLIGHQKYYCRNRPRLDDVPEPSCPTNSVKKLVVVPNNGIINSASSSTVTAAHHSLSSSAKKAAVMNAQCPFQAVNNESMSAHQKQQQQHSALPVICADCGYRAFTVRGLRTHVRLSHGTNSAEQTAAVNNKRAATTTTNGNGAAEAGERMASLDGTTTKYFEGTAAEGGE